MTGNLGQGQCTPSLLVQDPSQASLGAQSHGGEGKSSGSNLNSKWLGTTGSSTWLAACREDKGV